MCRGIFFPNKLPGTSSGDCLTPQKTKHFLWRACRGCLPRKTALRARGLPMPKNYVLCEHSIEDTLHLFLHCPFAIESWGLAALGPIANGMTSFNEW